VIGAAPEALAEVIWLLDSQLVATNRLIHQLHTMGYDRAAEILWFHARHLAVAIDDAAGIQVSA
jgi:hypothetical protein